MATLSKEGITSADTGILMPKLRYRFRVVFQTPGFEGQYDENTPLAPITMQAVKVWLPARTYQTPFGFDSESKILTFEFEDDILNRAAQVINEAGEAGTKFDMVVELLDGNETVLEQIKFRDCMFSEMSHIDPLDYAAGSRSNDIEIRFDPDAFVGKLVDDVDNGKELMDMLYVFFYNLKANINLARGDQPSATVRRQVSVTFESREDTYIAKPELK